jgi:hypothetical protein
MGKTASAVTFSCEIFFSERALALDYKSSMICTECFELRERWRHIERQRFRKKMRNFDITRFMTIGRKRLYLMRHNTERPIRTHAHTHISMYIERERERVSEGKIDRRNKKKCAAKEKLKDKERDRKKDRV